MPIPGLPPVMGDFAFAGAAFSGSPSTIMQEAHEHAAAWGAYASPEWGARAPPRAIIRWAQEQSERLAPHLRDQARRAEDAKAAYEHAQKAVAKSIRQAAFVRQIRLIAVALDPTANDAQVIQSGRRDPRQSA